MNYEIRQGVERARKELERRGKRECSWCGEAYAANSAGLCAPCQSAWDVWAEREDSMRQ